MKTQWSKTFDEEVICFFQPMATRAGLTMKNLRDGIYEITGQSFAIRIRRGTGHQKDFVVTLSTKKTNPDDLDDLSHEVGLGLIAEYNGKHLPATDLSSRENLLRAFQAAANMTDELCIPYLLGTRTDYDEICRFIERKIEASGIRTKKFHFPPNVREEWL